MCIDYRVGNNFIQLSSYPLPLIDDLLVGFEKTLWFMSLDMASGFWAIKMTERAKLISAFIRMPFGLKNAPLIYQQVINNCLWGFVRLPPEEEAEMTVFKTNIPAPTQMSPVLRRSSYIDDIAHGAPTWDALCADLDALLYRLRYWNISLPKSEFGKLSIPYLSHKISAEGIRATPKIAKGVQDLPFPTTLKGVQSFLGSLNYYHKFIEDYPVVAASLYELSDDQGEAGIRNSETQDRIDSGIETP
ncbi:reverse transcriptase [Phytophthora megakarya]|uniref:Reverse transcriptase n=1 Tax=Phytophthora megakarya TaxID=4795 RepID=A0A225UBB8_9STRA|nr:reverse transcriptase [Phytophthora megakarya]